MLYQLQILKAYHLMGSNSRNTSHKLVESGCTFGALQHGTSLHILTGFVQLSPLNMCQMYVIRMITMNYFISFRELKLLFLIMNCSKDQVWDKLYGPWNVP